MKCEACKYEYNVKYDEDGEEILIGDEQFIPSKTTLTYSPEKWELYNSTIWICPKCGALKIEL
jgi:hypothetical protein